MNGYWLVAPVAVSFVALTFGVVLGCWLGGKYIAWRYGPRSSFAVGTDRSAEE